MNKVEELEQRLGLNFADKQLLRQALTHGSYINERNSGDKNKGSQSNQRLEFLGDAVLGLVVADYLYTTFPDYDEGALTNLRSALVRRETLNEWAKSFELGKYLLLGKGEAASGGRERPLNLASAFEAILGALFREQGLPAVQAWLLPLVKAELERVIAEGRDRDYKTILQEMAQRVFHLPPLYEVVAETGPEHERTFEIEARIGEQTWGRGSGNTKQNAQQAAAKDALAALEQAGIDGK